MRNYKIISLVVICFLVLTTVLTGCSSSPASQGSGNEEKTVTLKLGHIRPTGSPADLDVKAFVEAVEKNSNGTIKVEVYPASELGDYTTVQERVAIGDVDMQLAPIGTNLNKAFGIASAPYIVTNWEEAGVVFTPGSKLINTMSDLLDEYNISLLSTYPVYFGGIALAEEPKDPGDASVPKGIKIRVPPMKAYELTAEALGYISTPIAFAEMFTAMQTGIVNGAIGAGAEGYYANLRDLTKYYLPLNDHFEMWFLYMNKETLNKLSANQQKVLQDAAKAMETKRFGDAEQQEKEFENKLQENGVEIIQFTDEELAAFAKLIREDVWPKIKDEFGAEIFDSIVSDIK